jgi:hypothetical protein
MRGETYVVVTSFMPLACPFEKEKCGDTHNLFRQRRELLEFAVLIMQILESAFELGLSAGMTRADAHKMHGCSTWWAFRWSCACLSGQAHRLSQFEGGR